MKVGSEVQPGPFMTYGKSMGNLSWLVTKEAKAMEYACQLPSP